METVNALAKLAFSDRSFSVNRFNSEPRFQPERVGNLYSTWVTAAIVDKRADLTLVYEEADVCGFMTFKLPSPAEKASGLNLGKAVLSAVHPAMHRNGIYRKLLLSGFKWLKENGVDYVEGKTQLSTVPVIRAWQKLGAELRIVYHTFHN